MLLASDLGAQSRLSPVGSAHLAQISQLFQSNGIRAATVGLDRQGRVELQGQFENDREVDVAFSLAQTVVGVRWVSPVTPEQVRVKAWADCLSRILAGEACGPPPAPGPAIPDTTPPGPLGTKYGLVVGVGRFQGPITPLQYANKDAYDVYTYLIDPAGGNFKRENVVLLRDEYATHESVVRALREIQQRAREDDLVLIYLSSHGTPPDKFGGVNVVTYDSEVQPRDRIWSTSLNENILREFVQNVRAKRLVLVMDACYSNGAYRQIQGFLPAGGKSLDAGADDGWGRSRQHMSRLLGAKDLVLDEGPVAATRAPVSTSGWGKVLISASDAGERSWESEQLRNSVFTRFMLEGLRRNRGAVKDAFDYAKPRVREQVKREKGAELEQNPQALPSRREWNLSIAGVGQ